MSDATVETLEVELTPEELLSELKKVDSRINMLEYSYNQLLYKALARGAAQRELVQLREAEQKRNELLSKATRDVHIAFETWKDEQLGEYERTLEKIEEKSSELARISTRDFQRDKKNPEYIQLKRQYDKLMINIDVKYFVLQRDRQKKAS